MDWRASFCVLLACTVLCSCADLGITKRRYRPGFHVDVRHNGKTRSTTLETERKKLEEQVNREMIMTQPNTLVQQLTAQIEQPHKRKIANVFFEEIEFRENIPVRKPKPESFEKTIREAKKTIPEKWSSKWQTIAIITMCVALFAFITMFVGFGILFNTVTDSRPSPLALALISTSGALALSGFITSIFAKKNIKSNGERGKGFAIVGFIAGLAALGVLIFGLFILTLFGPPNS